ncbi:hypothetical protein PSCICO_24760 [Pseudomonas cichorii]|nr:hypothetical protein PSCICO_24760 [Pseudomonas cichorii]
MLLQGGAPGFGRMPGVGALFADESHTVCAGANSFANNQSEEAQRIGVVAHQQVLGLLIMLQRHFMGLAAYA